MATKITKEMIEEAVKTYSHEKSTHFKPASELKEKTLKNTVKHIAKDANENDIIAVMAFNSLSGGGKDGMALTESRLYFSKDYYSLNDNKLSSIDISNFKTVYKYTSGTQNQDYLAIEYEDGSKIKFYCSIFTADILNFFKTLMSLRGDSIEESKKGTKAAASTLESAPEKAETKPTETAEEIEKRLRAEMEDELKKQREKLENEYAEKLKAATAPVSKPEPAPTVKAEPKTAPTPAVSPAPAVNAEPKAEKSSVKSAEPEVKPLEIKKESVPNESSMPSDYRDYFCSLKKPKKYYPLLYRPAEIANRIYVPTYRWMEDENGTPFYVYNLIDILDGSESTLGIIEEDGKIITSHAIETKLPGYSLIDPDDKDSLYGIAIIDHVYNYCNTAYMALGIYLNEGKFYDLQTNGTYELLGYERVKNTIKENDFVFACCHSGKYYLVETRKASFAQGAYYDESAYKWRFKENGVEKTVEYSPIIFHKTESNGKITTELSLPEKNRYYQLYYLADFKGVFSDAPTIFTEDKKASDAAAKDIVSEMLKAAYTATSKPAAKPQEVKKETAPVKTSTPVKQSTPAKKHSAKVLDVTKQLHAYNVFDFLGHTYLCLEDKENRNDTQSSNRIDYEYTCRDLESQQTKKILITETVKIREIQKEEKKSGPNFRYIPNPNGKYAPYSRNFDFIETEILKSTYEIFSDVQEEGFTKSSRYGYGEYSKRLPDMEFSILESKCCTVKHIGNHIFKDILSGTEYPLHESYPLNNKKFLEAHFYGAVIFENKAYPVFEPSFEKSKLAQYKNGQFTLFDGYFAFNSKTYVLPLYKYKKYLWQNGRDTLAEPIEGEYYELSFTLHSSDRSFSEMLFMTPVKLKTTYGVLLASKKQNKYSYSEDEKKEIKFTSYSGGYKYIVFPHSVSDEVFEKINDKVCFAKILSKAPDDHSECYAIVDKLYLGNEMDMQCITSNVASYTLKQKNGSLIVSIPKRMTQVRIEEGYEVRCTVCRHTDFASVSRDSTLCFVTAILKEAKQESKLPSTDKLVTVEISDLKKGDIYYNHEAFIAINMLELSDEDGFIDAIVGGVDIKERRDTYELITPEEYVNIVDRKLISIDKFPCEIEDDALIITTKNNGQIYLSKNMTYNVFGNKIPPKMVYTYHYGNTYYFAAGKRDETCV